MANTYEPRTTADAKATIQAELNKIMEDFNNSISRCLEAAEFLISDTVRPSKWPPPGRTNLMSLSR